MLFTAELEFRILLLPPISRGAHLAGPRLHAERLVELWRVDEGDVPLGEAFRLLGVEQVAGAIRRTVAAREYPGDPRHWTLPPLADLSPEMQELCWLAMLDGAVAVEAIKGVQGKRHRTVTPAELPRLRPDWQLSRFCRGERDEFVDVRVHRAVEPVPKRNRPSWEDLRTAMVEVAKANPEATEAKVWAALKVKLGPGVRRQDARDAIEHSAPQLKGRRGIHAKSKSPD